MRVILFIALTALLLSNLNDVANAKAASQQLTALKVETLKDAAQPRIIATGPRNIALLAGEQGRLGCISNRTADLHWHFVAHGSETSTQIVSACELNPAFIGAYSVERVGFGECDVIILSASVIRAGLYTCQETSGFDPVLSAEVVVIDSHPNCYQVLTTDGVLENEIVTFMCEVTYTSNLSPITYNWTDSAGNPILPTNDCFNRAVNISTILGLFSRPGEHDPPRKFYFGYLAGLNDVAGTNECERLCAAQPLCYSYTFISNSHPEITWYGECMGRNNDVDIHESYQYAFSETGIASLIHLYYEYRHGRQE